MGASDVGLEAGRGIGEEGLCMHIRMIEYCELHVKMSTTLCTQVPQGKNKTKHKTRQPSQGKHYLQGWTPVPDPLLRVAE